MILFILFFIPGGIIIIDFFIFLISGKRAVGNVGSIIWESLVLVVLPFLYLSIFDMGQLNDCCSESAFFSPEHRLTMYVLIVLCLAVYIFCRIRENMAGPLVELLLNALLIAGIVLNIIIAIQEGSGLWIIGNIPVIILFVYMLIKNQRLLDNYFSAHPLDQTSAINRSLESILRLKPILKIPVLLVICLPLLVCISCLLLIFGQKPDSMIRAFTETYKHGFSQLDYLCNNVDCGGHYLCSVAAKGHQKIVKPRRLGLRGGKLIMCNRQLLVSNAFEELLQQKCPAIHRVVRKKYNHVGNFIHRYYTIFNIKLVSDFVYVAMKPLEWVFLLVLYTFDQNPENRIARQYMSRQDRQQLDKY